MASPQNSENSPKFREFREIRDLKDKYMYKSIYAKYICASNKCAMLTWQRRRSENFPKVKINEARHGGITVLSIEDA